MQSSLQKRLGKKFEAQFVGVEVHDLQAATEAIGRGRIVQSEPAWVVLHDPEGRASHAEVKLNLLYCAPKRTETSLETPGSCIVTP